jgi:hypothetical protein
MIMEQTLGLLINMDFCILTLCYSSLPTSSNAEKPRRRKACDENKLEPVVPRESGRQKQLKKLSQASKQEQRRVGLKALKALLLESGDQLESGNQLETGDQLESGETCYMDLSESATPPDTWASRFREASVLKICEGWSDQVQEVSLLNSLWHAIMPR